MNRIQFFDSISGIQYPKMIVDFFDHFIALKQIVEDKGSVTVDNNNDSSIEFSIIFKSNSDRDLALSRTVNRKICSSCGMSYNTAVLELAPKIDGICDKSIMILSSFYA